MCLDVAERAAGEFEKYILQAGVVRLDGSDHDLRPAQVVERAA